MSYNLVNKAGILIPPAIQGFLLGSRTIITAAGTTAYTPPQYCKVLFFQVQGGGGGGKNCANSSSGQIVLGGGGCAGQYVELLVLAYKGAGGATSPGWSVGIGAGGAGNVGGSGGSTVVSGPAYTSAGAGAFNYATATGGSGGGTLASGTTTALIGPINGVGTGSSLVGIIPFSQGARYAYRDSGTLARSGSGGNSIFGAGGLGRITHGVGNAGLSYGAGGGGAMSVNAGGAVNGGAGAPGIVIIWEYF